LSFVVVTVAEWLVSRRALAVYFLLLAVLFVRAAWLRPPLSRDLSSLQIPLLPHQAGLSSSADLLCGQPPFRAASLGTPVLGLAGMGLLIVLVWPRQLGLVAGVLLSASLTATAALLLNYPALFEQMELELEERTQIVNVLTSSTNRSLSNDANGRVDGRPLPTGKVSAAPAQDSEWGNVERFWVYLLYSRWLIILAAAGVLSASSGSVGRRLLILTGWTLLSVGLSCAVCLHRLRAEYHWIEAKLLESQGDYAGARQALARSVAVFPELDRLQRTWVLAGKLDYREGRSTVYEQFFHALQLAHFHNVERERIHANALLRDLLADGSETVPPLVRRQAARLLTTSGLDEYNRAREQQRRLDPSARIALRMTGWQDPFLGAAEVAWQKAAALDPNRRDTAFFLGVIQSLSEKDSPEKAEAFYRRALEGNADLMLQADILASCGDAFFQAGRAEEARRRYAESFTVFSLAKTINFRAMLGLGGL